MKTLLIAACIIYISSAYATSGFEDKELAREIEKLVQRQTKHIQTQVDKLNHKYELLLKYVTESKHNVDHSFTAVLTEATEYMVNETIVFNDVITNNGDNYDTTTGIYTCPVSGLYEFSYSVATISNQGESVYSSMYRNDQLLVSASVWDSDGRAKMGSNRVFTQCDEGDQILIRAGEFDGNPVSLLAGDLNHCTFSGTFLEA